MRQIYMGIESMGRSCGQFNAQLRFVLNPAWHEGGQPTDLLVPVTMSIQLRKRFDLSGNAPPMGI